MVRASRGEGIQTCSLAKGNFLQVIRAPPWKKESPVVKCAGSDTRIQSLVLTLWPWSQQNLWKPSFSPLVIAASVCPPQPPPSRQRICWGLNEKNLCQGPHALYGTLKTRCGFQLFKKKPFLKMCRSGIDLPFFLLQVHVNYKPCYF